MILRDYQIDAIKHTIEKWTKFNRLLAVLPTGAGKTCIAANIVKERLIETQGRCLFLAHREELLTQAQEKFAVFGVNSELEKGELSASDDCNCVIGSVQTMVNRASKFGANAFDTVIVDECHHSVSDSYKHILDTFHKSKVLGITATPDRGDKRELGEYYEDISFEVGLLELIKRGYLSRIVARTVPIEIDLRAVRVSCGEFNATDLGATIEPYFDKIIDSILQYAPTRKTLVFLPLVATSEKFVALCNAKGIKALHVDGNSPDRKERLTAFSRGEYKLLSNSMLLTEGYDEPSVDCVICLRPTKSRPLYSQIVGRGTRIHTNKENLLLLDFLWNCERHSLIKAAHLIASSPQEAKEMTDKIGQDEMDLMEAQESTVADREAALLKQLEQRKKRESRLIDPIDFALSMHDMALAEFEPTMKWHEQSVTDAQANAIKGMGIDPSLIRNKGHASAILEVCFTRRKLKMATVKQVEFLKRLGHPTPNSVSFNDAAAYIDQTLKGRK